MTFSKLVNCRGCMEPTKKGAVRAARALSPKPRFCYLDLCCLIARLCFSVSSLFLFPFRYYLLYLNTAVFVSSKYRRSGAPCRCLFPPTLRARPGSQANAALEGHSHFSHSTAAGNPLNLLPTQSPSLPHEHTHALTSAYSAILSSHCTLIARSECDGRAALTGDLHSKLLMHTQFAERGSSPAELFTRFPNHYSASASSSRFSLDRECANSPQLSPKRHRRFSRHLSARVPR
ncbi:hypothetical protein V8E53_004030 [Lactarius tabidus]